MLKQWLILIIAGLFEIIWTVGLKYSSGFTKLYPSIIVVIAMLISIYGLSIAVRTIPIGTAYAVWTGIGAIGTVIAGIILFDEPSSFMKIFLIIIIVVSIIGLKLIEN